MLLDGQLETAGSTRGLLAPDTHFQFETAGNCGFRVRNPLCRIYFSLHSCIFTWHTITDNLKHSFSIFNLDILFLPLRLKRFCSHSFRTFNGVCADNQSAGRSIHKHIQGKRFEFPEAGNWWPGCWVSRHLSTSICFKTLPPSHHCKVRDNKLFHGSAYSVAGLTALEFRSLRTPVVINLHYQSFLWLAPDHMESRKQDGVISDMIWWV